MLTIEQTMPNLLIDGGIFKTLPQYGDYAPVQAGFDYCLNHSGLKPISRLTKHFLNDENELDGVKEIALADMIKNKYKAQWDRAWAVLMESVYDAISNTSRNFTHSETYDGEDIYHYGSTKTTNTMEYALNEKETTSKTFAEINQGANGNDKEKFIEQNKAHDDVNTIEGDEKDDSTEYGKTVTITDIGSGNVGTMTTQYLINEELKLRAKNFYDEVMFPCIDNELTIAIYGDLSNMTLYNPADLQLTQTSNGVELTYRNQTVTINNGTDGQDGQDGQNGLTPVLTLEENGDLYVEYEEVENE